MRIPDQLIPESKKTEDWCIDTARAIDTIARSYHNLHANGKKAYDIFYGFQDETDYEYLTGTGEFRTPAKVRWIPLARPYFDILISTAQSRPFEPMVYAVDDGSLDEKKQKMVDELIDSVFGKINERQSRLQNIGAQIDLMKQGMQPKEGQQPDPGQAMQLQLIQMKLEQAQQQVQRGFDSVDMSISAIQRKQGKSAQANYEHEIGVGLEYLFHKNGLRETFLKGFESALVLDQEIYTIDDIMEGHDPKVRWVNPMNIMYGVSMDAEYLDECPWVIEDRFLPVHQVITEFGAFMTKDQLSRTNGEGHDDISGLYGGWDFYSSNTFSSLPAGTEACHNYGINSGMSFMGNTRRVRRICWQSPRKLRAKQTTSKHDPSILHTHIIGDDEKVRKNETVLERYVSDWWEITVIGNDIFIKAGKCAFQHRDIRDIGKSYGPYVGHAYNGIDRRPYSRVEAVEHINILYNLIFFQVEKLMALSGIKGFIMDKAQLPVGMGWKEWYHHLQHGIGVIDSSKDKGRGHSGSFNQFSKIDLTFGEGIAQLNSVLDRLDVMIGKILGIPPQRMGEVTSNDQVGTNKQSIIQSNNTTEPIYYKHDLLKKRVMDRLINTLPFAWRNGKRGRFVAGQFGQKMFDIGSDGLGDRSFEVFFSDGGKEQRILDTTMQLMSNEYQNKGTVSIGQLISLYNMNNLREVQDAIEYYEKVAEKKAADRGQAESQNEQERMQMEQQFQIMAKKQLTDGEQLKAKLAEFEMQMENSQKQAALQAQLQIASSQDKTKLDIANQNTSVELQYLDEQKRSTDIDARLKQIELALDASGNLSSSLSSPRRKNNIADK